MGGVGLTGGQEGRGGFGGVFDGGSILTPPSAIPPSNLLEGVFELDILELMNVGQMLPHSVASSRHNSTNQTLVRDILVGFKMDPHVVGVGENLVAYGAWGRNGFLAHPP